jgi:hypothetical protein
VAQCHREICEEEENTKTREEEENTKTREEEERRRKYQDRKMLVQTDSELNKINHPCT